MKDMIIEASLIITLITIALVVTKFQVTKLEAQLAIADQTCVDKASYLIINHNRRFHYSALGISEPMQQKDWDEADVAVGTR